MVKYRIRLITIVAFLALSPVEALAAPPALASANWSVGAPNNLAVNPPSDDALVAFVAKVEGVEPNAHTTICSAHCVDLRHSANLSLVVATAEGRFCTSVIIDKTGSGFEWTIST